MRMTTGEQLREMAKLLPRYEVTTENADVFRARIAELEAELAALKEIPEQIELAGYKAGDGSLMSAESGAMFTAKHMDSYEPLITLAHHNAIVSSIRAKAAAPEKYKMQPYQTVDKGSTNYKAGWNACINAMLAAAPAQPQSDAVIVPRAIAERMAIDAAQYEHEHAVVHDNVQLWQQPGARLTLTVGDLRTVRALLGGDNENSTIL